MSGGIAIIGMACRYPDADSPAALWQNVLARRQAFRRIPPERLRVEDYVDPDPAVPDRTYSDQAALLYGYAFDRLRFRVSADSFLAADPTHWLALDVTTGALASAGFPEGAGLPRPTTGAVIGNTLTGEFSRAAVLRLRWPFVRRTLDEGLAEAGWSAERRRSFLERVEGRYKAPFPAVTGESLAGGLSNTIAGRIANHMDLQGGAYTVDGACASSLLAVITACNLLTGGDLDVAIAGGVDLSLDPFELVGFAKAGALARDEMRVYDRRSAGFWPGEGCGVVVLVREADAGALGREPYAVIRGWGVSSDGRGGITRPEVEGQALALERAYRRAGFGIDTVAYLEGHGTGTAVGDATEIRTLVRARRDAGASAAAALGSVKANIGHTKAAAGVAGLLKACMAVRSGVIPPNTGCDEPHPELAGDRPVLRTLDAAEPWSDGTPRRAGVSAMGFGGINTHVVLEAVGGEPPRREIRSARRLAASAQAVELFLLDAPESPALSGAAERLASYAAALSRSEMIDLAVRLSFETDAGAPVRGAVVAASPAQLEARLRALAAAAAAGDHRIDVDGGVFLGTGAPGRIGFLFPGQGVVLARDGGAAGRRFRAARRVFRRLTLPPGTGTDAAQPTIAAAALSGLELMRALGIPAAAALGHSLGELCALHWAGALDARTLLRLAAVRGRILATACDPGAMAILATDGGTAAALVQGTGAVVSGWNGPRRTAVSGASGAIETVLRLARDRRIPGVRLLVDRAFHSPLMAPAVRMWREALDDLRTGRPGPLVFSTVTGDELDPDLDVVEHLVRHVTAPVRLVDALNAAAGRVDLWVEVGPGETLGTLVREAGDTPAISLDVGGPGLRGVLLAAGAAHALGVLGRPRALARGRFARPFDLDWRPRFLANPCESGMDERAALPAEHAVRDMAPAHSEGLTVDSEQGGPSALAVVRGLVAERTNLPVAAVRAEDRLLGDLHLNSMVVAEIVTEAARRLDVAPPLDPTSYADATVSAAAEALSEGAVARAASPGELAPAGVRSWIRAFTVEPRPAPRKPGTGRHSAAMPAGWRVLGPAGHPLLDALRERLGGEGEPACIVVCLPPEPDEASADLLVSAAREAAAHGDRARLAIVHQGGRVEGFARTFHREVGAAATCTVDLPFEAAAAADLAVAEIEAATGHVEVSYDAAGHRYTAGLRPLPLPVEAGDTPLEAGDVLLVTGGGKGIGAESALDLAQRHGLRLAVLGRSDPERDADLRTNLQRFAAAGLRVLYLTADVTDGAAVSAAVRRAEAELGPIAAILHAAGANHPRRIATLREEQARETLAPKLAGLRHLLAAVDPARLRLLVAFGSVIARTGLHGEADYALANGWQARAVDRFARENPGCRCLCVEWSVWSGAGMGERLGRIDALAREGIAPLGADQAVAMLARLIASPRAHGAVVVAGRLGHESPIPVSGPSLPPLRFLERPRVHYPGIELVTDARISVATDPYLQDHVVGTEVVFPAVMALEAMAQAATALVGGAVPAGFEDVEFSRAITMAPDASRTLRVAALVRGRGRVDVVIRSEETRFQVDHVRAVCRLRPRTAADAAACIPGHRVPERKGRRSADVLIGADLYDRLLFHGGRFRRVETLRGLSASGCVARVRTDADQVWFQAFLPDALVLGDPAARDAALHSIQACVPGSRVLPTAVGRIELRRFLSEGFSEARSREIASTETDFTYDLEVRDGRRLLERWRGLRLRALEPQSGGAWPASLVGPLVERELRTVLPACSIAVAAARASPTRRVGANGALLRRLARSPVLRRPDGKPEASGGPAVSAGSGGGLTLAVAAPGTVACDVEPVAARPPGVWADLLGSDGYALARIIVAETGEPLDAAATRVWCAREAAKKAGTAADTPMLFDSARTDGWVLLRAGQAAIATRLIDLRSAPGPLALGILASGADRLRAPMRPAPAASVVGGGDRPTRLVP